MRQLVARAAPVLATVLVLASGAAAAGQGRPVSDAEQMAQTGNAAPGTTTSEVVTTFGDGNCPNLGLFDANTGRLLRLLIRHVYAQLLSAGPDRSIYFVEPRPFPGEPAACRRQARRDGPKTQLLSLSTGRYRPVSVGSNSLSVSPDGRVRAWIGGGYARPKLVVEDVGTGRRRRVLLVRNAPHATGAIGTAQMSWAPDDRRLAISPFGVPSGSAITVIRPWSVPARRPIVGTAPKVAGCGSYCAVPQFDVTGKLHFFRLVGINRNRSRNKIDISNGRSFWTQFNLRGALDSPSGEVFISRHGQVLWTTMNGTVHLYDHGHQHCVGGAASGLNGFGDVLWVQ